MKDHFLKPHNIATEDSQIDEIDANGVGEVGSPACGDVMKMWLHIDEKEDRIKELTDYFISIAGTADCKELRKKKVPFCAECIANLAVYIEES